MATQGYSGGIIGKEWSKKNLPHLASSDTANSHLWTVCVCPAPYTLVSVSESFCSLSFHGNYFVIFFAPVIVQEEISAGRITNEIYIVIIVPAYFQCMETKLYRISALINPR